MGKRKQLKAEDRKVINKSCELDRRSISATCLLYLATFFTEPANLHNMIHGH